MKQNSKGFSLIEISIVLSIIGILMGFSLKGRELIESARVRSVISQVESYKAAVQIFFEKYSAIPGDLKDASKLIANDISNGYQNGKIETLEDAKRFWEHLYKSNLISSESIEGLPTTKMGGVISVSSIVKENGIWLVWCAETTDNADYKPITTEKIAYKIVKSMDNGDFESGDVQVLKNGNDENNCVILFRIW